ncbi:hypothetical protein ACWKT5_34655 [Streptomyces avermitilis]
MRVAPRRALDGAPQAIVGLRRSADGLESGSSRPALPFAVQRVEARGETSDVPMAMRLHGPLDRAAMRRALSELLLRHEALQLSLRGAARLPVSV